MTLGSIVKQYREEHNMSMDEFSKRCTLSKGYISMIENNINPRNNKPIAPTLPSINKLAKGMGIELDSLLKLIDGEQLVSLPPAQPTVKKGVTINILGRVAAGLPIEAIENIIDTEEISEEMARTGEYFGLQIHGDSMEPRMYEGDIVIVRKQEDAESGEIVIAMVNGNDAVCKRLMKYAGGISLISLNSSKYEPMMYSNEEIETKPVKIIGKVVELRSKF